MDRLKQIWTSYKELHAERLEAQHRSLPRPNERQGSNSDTAESTGEEQFSARTYDIDKVIAL